MYINNESFGTYPVYMYMYCDFLYILKEDYDDLRTAEFLFRSFALVPLQKTSILFCVVLFSILA